MSLPATPQAPRATAMDAHTKRALALRRYAPILALSLWAGCLYFQDLGGRSFWYDEAWVATSVLSPSLGAAFEIEDAPQSTPPLFLAALWLVARVAPSEAALRLIPALCALLAVPLFYMLARRLTGRDGLALIGAALLAFSPAFLRYARELKQYSGDAAVAVVLFLLTERYCASRRRRDLVALAGAAAVGVWFSSVSVVAVVALLTRMAVAAHTTDGDGATRRPVAARLRAWALPIAALALAAGFSFGLEYLVVLRGLANDSYLRGFWRSQFLSEATLPESAALAVERTRELAAFLARYHPGKGLALFSLYVVGSLAALLRRRLALAVYAIVPTLVAATLALLERYPFGGNRTDLFLLPSVCLGVAGAFALAWPSSPGRERVALALVGLGVVWIGTQATWLQLSRPFRREELREPLAAMQALRQPGDYVYVYYGAKPAFRYYARGAWDARTVIGGEHRGSPESYREELRQLLDGSQRPARWWLVFSHFGVREDERDLVKQSFRERCRRGVRFSDYGAEVALFVCGANAGM